MDIHLAAAMPYHNHAIGLRCSLLPDTKGIEVTLNIIADSWGDIEKKNHMLQMMVG
jgi:hypothetical protein